MTFDRWGPNDEYPDDPDFECEDCGHTFNAEIGQPRRVWRFAPTCPECDSENVGGGGYYG